MYAMTVSSIPYQGDTAISVWAAPAILMLFTLIYTGCSNPVSSTDASGIQKKPYDDIVTPIDETAKPESSAVDLLATLPQINAGPRQYADTNVLVNLTGTVSLFENTEIASISWVQVDGPNAYIVDPGALETTVLIPDLNEVALLRFLLIATDEAGRTNAASTTVIAMPQPAFARVAGTVVEPETGLATFKIRLSNPVPEPIVINYQTIEGTALENVDYLPLTGEVTFAANETEREVPVEILQNSSRESARYFSLQITSSLGEEEFFNSGVMALATVSPGSFKPELVFSEAGPVRLIVGETFFNPLEDYWLDSREADIRYFSSDSAIAAVDAQGVVTAHASGTATINAVIPANAFQEEVNAAYVVQVEPLDVDELRTYGSIYMGEIRDYRGTRDWDLDGSLEDKKVDLSWEAAHYRLTPLNGAKIVVIGIQGYDSVTLQQLMQLEYSSDPIAGSDTPDNPLSPGTVMGVLTNEGRYSKLIIDEYDNDLRARYSTYGEAAFFPE